MCLSSLKNAFQGVGGLASMLGSKPQGLIQALPGLKAGGMGGVAEMLGSKPQGLVQAAPAALAQIQQPGNATAPESYSPLGNIFSAAAPMDGAAQPINANGMPRGLLYQVPEGERAARIVS